MIQGEQYFYMKPKCPILVTVTLVDWPNKRVNVETKNKMFVYTDVHFAEFITVDQMYERLKNIMK